MLVIKNIELELLSSEVIDEFNTYFSIFKNFLNERVINNDYSFRNEISKVEKFCNLWEKFLKIEEILNFIDASPKLLDEDEFSDEKNVKSAEKKDIINSIYNLIEEDSEREEEVLLEIDPKVGGEEAVDFAKEIYRMYLRLFEKKKWKFVEKTGGKNLLILEVKGKNSYVLLRNESGTHRVKRIPPKTESKGRIQTSTISVFVVLFSSKTKVNIKLDEKRDVEVQVTRSSGAGGQHVNTTNSAVKVIHKETGITSESQNNRSQHENKFEALKNLERKVNDYYNGEKLRQHEEFKRRSTANAERSSKIRTYNFSTNSVIDERIDKIFPYREVVFENKLLDLLEELHSKTFINRIKVFLTKLDNFIKEGKKEKN